MPLIAIRGPFGGNQLITALNAFHPEVGTTIGHYRHGTPPLWRCHEMAQRGNGIMAINSGVQKSKTFSNDRSDIPPNSKFPIFLLEALKCANKSDQHQIPGQWVTFNRSTRKG
jgi:hypothetical protein